jgi:hypothetical protein
MSPYIVASWLNHSVCLHARAARCARIGLNDTQPSTEIAQVPQEFGLSLRQAKQDQPIDLSGTAQSARKGCAFSFGLARSDFCHPDLMRNERVYDSSSAPVESARRPQIGLGANWLQLPRRFFHGALRAIGSTGQLKEY